MRKYFGLVAAVACLVALPLGTALAQDMNPNQRTYFTFSSQFELPGKTLPAGKYLFKVLDSPSNRHIVQVFDADEKNILATVLAIPAQRMDPSDEPEVRFMEVAANQPPAVKTWWYPARTIGHEFIYPKEQAMRLARSANTSVLTVSTDETSDAAMREAELARINAAGQVSANETEAGATTQTATAATARAESTPPPAPTTPSPRTTVPQNPEVTNRDVRATTTRTELPHTATMLPLLALIGFGSLGAAASLRLRRK